jgi:glycosyl-4,4'-diaponeurosporenoate acyltransferase
MRIFFFPLPVTLLLDVAVWLVIQFGVSKVVTGMGLHWFNPNGWIYRPRRWERGGELFETLGVKRWKERLPDAAPWFKGGFPKARLASRSRGYLERFALETCRGELAHWMAMTTAPLFFLWNRPWVGGLMVAYAVGGNIPCIIVQRYNRYRLNRLLTLSR